jgi:hypothetical protein
VHKIALLHEMARPPKFLTGDDCQFFLNSEIATWHEIVLLHESVLRPVACVVKAPNNPIHADDRNERFAGVTFRAFCFSMAIKANRQTSQLEFNLNSGGTIFAVNKTVLSKQLRVFQDDTLQLNLSKYQVKTEVPREI